MDRNDVYKEALASANAIIAFSDNTVSHLREKLSKKGFEEDAVEYAVQRMVQAGLVDDRRFLHSYVDYLARVKQYGTRRICPELIKKGFEKKLLNEELFACLEEIDFGEVCYKYIVRKALEAKLLNKETRDKAAAALMRHGFEYKHIKYALKKVMENNEED